MSINLKTVFSSIEVPNNAATLTSDYIPTKIDLSSFYEGNKRKYSLQIGFLDENKEYKHIQLDNENVKELIKELTTNFL